MDLKIPKKHKTGKEVININGEGCTHLSQMSSTNWSVDKRHAPIVVLTSRDITSVGIWTTEIAPYVVLI